MAQYVVVGVAEIEARDALSAWQQAHQGANALKWEVASVAPSRHPERVATFATTLSSRVDRVQTRRQIALLAGLLAALAFPSDLVLTMLFPGI